MVIEDCISYFKRMFFSLNKGVYCLQVIVSTWESVKYYFHTFVFSSMLLCKGSWIYTPENMNVISYIKPSA
jgi:hypothetical protein